MKLCMTSDIHFIPKLYSHLVQHKSLILSCLAMVHIFAKQMAQLLLIVLIYSKHLLQALHVSVEYHVLVNKLLYVHFLISFKIRFLILMNGLLIFVNHFNFLILENLVILVTSLLEYVIINDESLDFVILISSICS